jgi:NitT/TauT family transport system substrate-binding protein
MFPVYAKKVGIDPKLVTFLPTPPPNLPQVLAAGKVQGIGQFAVGKPLIEKADPKHREAVYLSYGKDLPELYGNTIITRSDLAKDHPDQVKKFSNALLKGLQDTYSDPAAAAAILKKYVPNTDVDVATKELEIMREYIKPPGFNGPLGEVTQERVQKVISLLEESKAIGAGALKPEDLVTLSLAPKS